MKQDIYDDPHGLDAWDQRHSSRCFVPHVVALGKRRGRRVREGDADGVPA